LQSAPKLFNYSQILSYGFIIFVIEFLAVISSTILIYLIARKVWSVPDLGIKHAFIISFLMNMATRITSELLR